MKAAGRNFLLFVLVLAVVFAGLLFFLKRPGLYLGVFSGPENKDGAGEVLWGRFEGEVETYVEDFGEMVAEMEGRSFGSEKILDACWTDSELAGSSLDRRVVRHLKDPFTGPPERTLPRRVFPSLPPGLSGSIRSVKPGDGRKVVALTFDLCERTPHRTGYDAGIVNYLRREKIKATFFAGGKWMHSHPEKTMQLMADPLFEVGNHAWTHGNLRVIKGRDMRNQVLWTQAQYELLRKELSGLSCAEGLREEMDKIPRSMGVFRFPYGTCSDEALSFLAEIGLPAVQWDVVTGDPSPRCRAEDIADDVRRNVKPGSIVIMHANGYGHGTAESLPLFVPELRERGYSFLTISELLESGKAETADTCYSLEPGDNKDIDRIYGRGT